MTALTAEEFITWANRLAGLPWPMALEEFTAVALKDFGWDLGNGGKHFIATFSEHVEFVMFSVNDINEIDDVLFFIARGDPNERENILSLNDLFVAYVSAGTEAWGKEVQKKLGKEQSATWKIRDGRILKLERSSKFILFTFYTPQGARYYE